jgi:hypothetical protein
MYAWLQAVGVLDLPAWDAGGSVLLGERLLEVAQPFGRYFSLLKEGDASTYRYVYTLLHTYRSRGRPVCFDTAHVPR